MVVHIEAERQIGDEVPRVSAPVSRGGFLYDAPMMTREKSGWRSSTVSRMDSAVRKDIDRTLFTMLPISHQTGRGFFFFARVFFQAGMVITRDIKKKIKESCTTTIIPPPELMVPT